MKCNIITLLLAALLLVACKSQEQVTDKTHKETTEITRATLDSIYRAMATKDSVYVRDSTHTIERHDSVIIYHERETFHVRDNSDKQVELRHDTLYVYQERVDSIYVQPISKSNATRTYIYLFAVIIALIIVSFIVIWIAKKMKRK